MVISLLALDCAKNIYFECSEKSRNIKFLERSHPHLYVLKYPSVISERVSIEIKNLNYFISVAMMSLAFLMLINLLLILTGVYLYKGIKLNYVSYIRPYLFISLISAVAFFLQIVIGNIFLKLASVIAGIIQIYGFVVIYSLHHKINNKKVAVKA